MREILFRAKSKNYRLNAKDKHWVYGSLVRGEVLFPEKKEEYFIVELSNRGDCTYEVEPETICQYTGLTDKNGEKIFIGDIIRCSKGCPHEVIWLKEYAGTYFGGMPAVYLSGLREGYAWTGSEEKIGNIFDDPELLKGE